MITQEQLSKIQSVSSGTPPADDTTEQTQTPVDPCDTTGASPSDICNSLATAEGSGSYTQSNPNTGASGRYQFIESTALGVLVKSGLSSSKADAQVLWNRCKQSGSAECKKVQDGMCEHYSKTIANSLNRRGIPDTVEFRYLGHNQGAGGANAIWRSMQTGEPVTNKNILRNMRGQAWAFSADGKEFYNNMVNHLKERGVNLNT